jgi:DTW domain-containing protein YfiP
VAHETRTRVLIVQHRRERDMPIGTARMAHLGLVGSELHVGVRFDDDDALRARLSAPHTYLLFPDASARDVEEVAEELRAAAVAPTLVVVDGTWWQARSLVRKNRVLEALPRVRLRPAAPSRYRIRREPAEHCVSTIEALAQVLGVLEGRPGAFETLLRPFDAMVEAQLRYAEERRGYSVRHARARARRADAGRVRGRVVLPELLRAAPERLLCVHAEANAWSADLPDAPPHELVHWLAVRPATGARFEAVLAPRGPLSPSTPRHTELDAERLRAGEPLDEARARWAAFVREGDVLCTWGVWPVAIAAHDGFGPLPPLRVDLRVAAHHALHARSGGIEAAADRLGGPPIDALGEGRGGRRLAALARVVLALRARAD